MRQIVARGEAQLRALAETILGLSPDKPWRVQFAPHKANRSLQQNAYYWALLTEIAKGTGHTSEEVHEAMKAKFLPPRFVELGDEVIHYPATTTKLDTAEMTDFIERVRAWAASELGVVV